MPKFYSNSNGQIMMAVPTALARELGLKPGDEYHAKKRKRGAPAGFDVVLRVR